MSTITHKNLQELCRACLKSLKNTNQPRESLEDCFDDGEYISKEPPPNNINNLLLLPNLCKLFLLFTNYDVTNEYEDFPKRLCEWCYGKLNDYERFRKVVFQSTETLYEIWSSKQETDKIKNLQHNEDVIEKREVKVEKGLPSHKSLKFDHKRDEEENDDNKLLLPELANMPLNIKPEPFFEAMEPQFSIPSVIEEGEINGDHSSYESNDSEEDADDEELLLPNGAANNSSPSMYNSDSKAAQQVRATKRDRNKKSIYCNMCNKQFYKQVYLDAHIRGTHMGIPKPFLCVNCPKSFTRYKQLHLHAKSQHIDMIFRCDFQNCNATFPGEITLKTHRQAVHNSSEDSTAPDYQDDGDDQDDLEMDHTCQLCWRKYSSARALRDHIKRHKQIKEHVCRECGVAKVTRTELTTHMRTHLPNLEKFPCPQCPQVFNHKNAISRHVRVIHEGVKRFACSFCTKRFGTRNSQVCHERLHTGERPFICEICQKAFVQQEGLRSHMKNHDKTLRTHVCKHCSQRFITLKNLIDHERRHMSDRPHICNICSKGFYKAEDLRIHRSSHYEAVGDEDRDVVVKSEVDVNFFQSNKDPFNIEENSSQHGILI